MNSLCAGNTPTLLTSDNVHNQMDGWLVRALQHFKQVHSGYNLHSE